MPLPLNYDFLNQIIEVPSPDSTISLQYLVNQTRDVEDNDVGITYGKILDAFGKQPLGQGNFVGITVVLLDNWRLRFEARPGPTTELMTVNGGNIVHEDQGNPIAPSAFTSVVIAQSASPTITVPTSDTHVLYLIESLLGKQKTTNTRYIYWDPQSGSDANDGTLPERAVRTFSRAQLIASDGGYDTIFALSTGPEGTTIVNELITITKSGIKLRGPGHSLQLVPGADTAPTIDIQADNVEISGIYISTAGTGTPSAVNITGDNTYIRDCWVSNARGHGINVTGSNLFRISNSAIEDVGLSGTGNGINIASSTSKGLVSNCIITNAQAGIFLSGSNITDNLFENNLIYQHTTFGLDIGSGVSRTGVRGGHTFANNGSGDTRDNGTDTFIEQPLGGLTPAQIANAVWDEVINDHITTGTTGKALRDAKTRATLASLS